MPGPGNPNKTMQQDYVIGPDGKTLGFYDQFGRFVPSSASSTQANPYVGGQGMPTLMINQSNFEPQQTMKNMASVMLGTTLPPAPPPDPAPNELPPMPSNLMDKFGVMPNFPKVGAIPGQDGSSLVQSLQQNLANAEVETPTDTTIPTGLAAAGDQQALNPNRSKGGIGRAASMISALGSKMGNGYNQRVGMERPSLGKSMTDLQLTQMGSSLGPAGTAVGFAADMVKNLRAFQKHKSQYNKAETKADFYDTRENLQQAMGTDFTGLAKYGMKVKGGYGMKAREGMEVPVELENSEVVYVPTKDGGYQEYMETSADAPKHEDGGVKTTLPQGAVVFPKEFKKEAKMAFASGGKTGDWSKFNSVKNQMLNRANKAYLDGKPFSTGGAMAYGGQYGNGGGVPMMPGMTSPQAPFLQSMKPLEGKDEKRMVLRSGEGDIMIDDDGHLYTEGVDPRTIKKKDQTTKTPPPIKTGSGRLPIGSVKHTGNRGVVSGQQEILNDMIKQARANGSTDVPEYLVVDDVMGQRTREAMNYFQQQGVYQTPELLSSANVAQYQQNWKNMSASEKQKALLAGASAIGLTQEQLDQGIYTTRGTKTTGGKETTKPKTEGKTQGKTVPGVGGTSFIGGGGSQSTASGQATNPYISAMDELAELLNKGWDSLTDAEKERAKQLKKAALEGDLSGVTPPKRPKDAQEEPSAVKMIGDEGGNLPLSMGDMPWYLKGPFYERRKQEEASYKGEAMYQRVRPFSEDMIMKMGSLDYIDARNQEEQIYQKNLDKLYRDNPKITEAELGGMSHDELVELHLNLGFSERDAKENASIEMAADLELFANEKLGIKKDFEKGQFVGPDGNVIAASDISRTLRNMGYDISVDRLDQYLKDRNLYSKSKMPTIGKTKAAQASMKDVKESASLSFKERNYMNLLSYRKSAGQKLSPSEEKALENLMKRAKR